MRKLKHSKIKNSAILFELLLRQVSVDVVSGNMNSRALSVIKDQFGKGSEISKELELYQTLVNTKLSTESKASVLIEAAIQARKRLNSSKLRHEKYQIIKEIQSAFKLDAFFSSQLPNYKQYASIYKLFEAAESHEPIDPVDISQSKSTLVEYISTKSTSRITQRSRVFVEYEKQPEEIRLLATKLLIDKFNRKYSVLTEGQKVLLRKFINNTSGSFRTYVESIVPTLKVDLSKYTSKVKDVVVRIKLVEVTKQLDKFSKGRELKDEQVVSLLNYYQLVEELKKL